MSSSKELKQKIKSVESLQKITKAMEMIARSNMKKSIELALLTRLYATLGLELLVNISMDDSHKNIFLKKGSKGSKILVVYVASDKGLCGSYNSQIFKNAKKYFDHHKHYTKPIDFITIGKYAYNHTLKLKGNVLANFQNIKDFKDFIHGEQIYNLVLNLYKTSEYHKAVIIYTNYRTIFQREVTIRELLPLSKSSLRNTIETLGGIETDVHLGTLKHSGFNKYLYEPSPNYVLEKIIPELVSTQIYQSILESRASEESSRMVAMKSASDNGEKISKQLKIIYNSLRQASITKEIIEISSGASLSV